MKKKKMVKITAIVVLFGLSLLSACLFIKTNAQERQASCKVFKEQDFVDDEVVVIFTKEATLQFLDYTPESFPEIDCIAVNDLTIGTVDYVKNELNGVPNEKEMAVKVENFRRMLCLKLGKNDKKNVLKAVEILSRREDIETVTPNYYDQVASATNDNLMSEQWSLNNINAYSA